jgi:non-heme chloroperoxidase
MRVAAHEEDASMPPRQLDSLTFTRRQALQVGASALAVMALPSFATARTPTPPLETMHMSDNFVTTKDGVRIFYKDWGPRDAQPIVFHHGWPLSSDDWDTQMLFFLQHGYR